MSIVTETYTRKPFEVEAVRVTEQNMEEVAEWCGGFIPEVSEGAKRYIKVDVVRPLNEKQTKAFPGDWVLKVRNTFKVYQAKPFTHCFDRGTIETNYLPGGVTKTDPNQDALFDVRPTPKIHTLPQGYPEPSTR